MATVARATLYPGTCETGTREKSSRAIYGTVQAIEQGPYTFMNSVQTNENNTVTGIH